MEASLSAANLYDRETVCARGVPKGKLPGRFAPLVDTSGGTKGMAVRGLGGWRLRMLSGIITGYYRPPPLPKPTSLWARCVGRTARVSRGRRLRIEGCGGGCVKACEAN